MQTSSDTEPEELARERVNDYSSEDDRFDFSNGYRHAAHGAWRSEEVCNR